VLSGIHTVLELERRAGVRSTWFILCGTPTVATVRAGDLTYSPESPRARYIIREAAAAGHEIGLHGSFATLDDDGRFVEQRARLATIAGVEPLGIRQHFLRMRPGATQKAMAHAGFRYDSTFGFSDRNGFRLGVGDVIPGWDPATGSRLDVDEVPMVWMDRALSKYQRIEDPARWVDDGLALASACRETNGIWVGLWHPNLTPALGYPGAPAAFASLLSGLAESEPHFTTLADAVRWRRSRRALRATGIRPDGAVDFSASEFVPLEDA
jgi:peptidoglycan/xylan/chitin deacetylase (PgdA/CDA1 family)